MGEFKGPIEKLLELVTEKKLDITEVSLAQVTGDFLDYFETLRQTQGISEEDSEDLKSLLADFLVVASRLLLIKSKVLLPALEFDEEEEEDIRDLELRLKLYREIAGTKDVVREMWRTFPQILSREFLATREAVFLPPKNIRPEHLRESMAQAVGELERELLPTEKIRHVVVRIGDKIKDLLARLTSDKFDIGHLDKQTPKEEVVVLFLAVLHLVRDYPVDVEQEGEFGKIYIKKQEERSKN